MMNTFAEQVSVTGHAVPLLNPDSSCYRSAIAKKGTGWLKYYFAGERSHRLSHRT